jgi:hypothetical protein
MKSLFQRNWYTEVRRSTTTGLLKVGSSYLDTQREAAAHLLVDIHTFIIKEALWEEPRALKPDSICSRQVTPLLGAEAYLGSSPALRETAAFLNDPLAVTLFSENIKGIIQTERHLLEERGYASPEEYYLKWVKNGLNSCRFFSNLDRVEITADNRTREFRPAGNLFVRFKNQNLYSLGEDQYLLTGDFSDSYHEVNVNLKLDGFTVEKADGGFVRAPNPVCREAQVFLSSLHGIDLRDHSKKEIAGILGKGQGCVHMIDLVHDCAQMLGFIGKS